MNHLQWLTCLGLVALTCLAGAQDAATPYIPPEEAASARDANRAAAISGRTGNASSAATAGASAGNAVAVNDDDQVQVTRIFEEYVAALGGEEALRKLESRVIRGTVESGGKTVEFESHQLADGRFALLQEFPDDPFRLSHDGTNTWTMTGSETWRNLSEQDAAIERIDNHLLNALHWRASFPQRQLLPAEMINGRRAEGVEVTYANGKTRKLYFDVKTHRLVRTDSMTLGANGRPMNLQVFAKDFRSVNGLVVPFITETRVGGRTLVATVHSVVHDGPVDLNLINPPVGKTAGSGFRDSERFFEKLTIGELSYENVWVHRQTNYNVLIRHAGGIQTIKLTALPKADLEALRPQLGDLARIDDESKLAVLNEKVKSFELDGDVREALDARFAQANELLTLLKWPLLLVALLAHLVFSIYVVSLCRRTDTKAGIAAWLPLFNQTALMRAAGMYGHWPLLGVMGYLTIGAAFGNQQLSPASPTGLIIMLLALVLVTITAVMWLVWCFKICIARKRSGWLGLLLLIPGVNLVTITYLAFAE